ncbi:hypothetical protein [Erythrobacter litoralis]|uniref:HTH marR-type domain-containing protein n=1 Tax=Erythrobacter litoralis (strain HTCC2594) TaxID=314225 RepID=Q2NAQ0_ERYLH|nr:hypothetical protein [Erythrobacter litoralis]ABC63241.1 hypothetical protein ELI_05745 [Erythrobacter litoralis HTCC2594]
MPTGAKNNRKTPRSYAKGDDGEDAASIADIGPTGRAASQIYRLRRRREELFGVPDLFGDPAWDILLDLYIASCKGKAVSVSSACVAACVPATTALRYLSRLEQLGLIARSADKNDRRRVLVALSGPAKMTIKEFLVEQGSQTVV